MSTVRIPEQMSGDRFGDKWWYRLHPDQYRVDEYGQEFLEWYYSDLNLNQKDAQVFLKEKGIRLSEDMIQVFLHMVQKKESYEESIKDYGETKEIDLPDGEYDIPVLLFNGSPSSNMLGWYPIDRGKLVKIYTDEYGYQRGKIYIKDLDTGALGKTRFDYPMFAILEETK